MVSHHVRQDDLQKVFVKDVQDGCSLGSYITRGNEKASEEK